MRRCLDCGALIRLGSRCRSCQRTHDLQRSARRGPSGWARQKTVERILDRDMHMCRLCGQTATVVDHIIPLAKGGADADFNMRSLCRPCHQRVTNAEFRGRGA